MNVLRLEMDIFFFFRSVREDFLDIFVLELFLVSSFGLEVDWVVIGL